MFPRRWFQFGLAIVGLLLGLWVLFNGKSGMLVPESHDSTVPEPDTASGPRSSERDGLSVRYKSERTVFTPRRRAEDEWTWRWREIQSQPRNAARDEDMVTFVEELAAIDPWRAISLAQSEGDPELRIELFEAALRGWGAANPEAALAWATDQALLDSNRAMAAVFHGLARDPEAALRFTAQCSERDPDRAQDYGSLLVAALARLGEFEQAAAFAANGALPSQADWLNSAYARWADSDPRAAMEHIAQIKDPGVHRTAFDVAIQHWATSAPRAATEYAFTLGAGTDRTFALSTALRSWASSDAVAAAQWMNRVDPSPELDMGVATLATGMDLILQPNVAAGWAESIVDPQLRVRVLATVMNTWAAFDRAAAQQYAENSVDIRNEDRPALFSAFEVGFNPLSWSP
jgi:hypothetical protein